MEAFRNIFEEVVGKSQHNSRWNLLQQRLTAIKLQISAPGQKRRPLRDPSLSCKGLVALMTADQNGTWIPKRCSRGCLPGSDYCKTHGRQVQHQICQQCTEHHGQEIRHHFLHEHFGIVDQPSYHFTDNLYREKFIKQSLKEKKNSQHNNNNNSQDNNNNNNKKNKKQKKQRNPHAPPIIPNAFMSWLKVNRAQIKAEIQSKNPQMSARDLMVSTTKQAGILWKLLSKSDQDKWKSSSTSQQQSSDIIQILPNDNDNNTINQPNCQQDSISPPTTDDTETTPLAIDEQDDDESVVLVYNQTHKVWLEDATGLYYKDNNPDQPPMGQIVAGKLVPFKKNTRTLTKRS